MLLFLPIAPRVAEARSSSRSQFDACCADAVFCFSLHIAYLVGTGKGGQVCG